ncbi:MAG TPA: acyl-CoA dehydrogenase, partial [Balneolaceae bacterium]|nr:acyl-CoA dehydrogenase [Balneolaceae bacterium]
EVDEDHKLQPKTTGVTMMLDLLHRSRLQFPGMGMGFLKRMLDEAVDHCKSRIVGGTSLINYDQVRHRVSEIQAYFTVCSAMCNFTSTNVPLTKNTSRMDLEANAIKSLLTDYMQRASQSLLQLKGAMGYRM